MHDDQPSSPADDDSLTGDEPVISDGRSVSEPIPVTGDEPTLSGDEGLLHALEMTLHQDRTVRYNAVVALEQFKDIKIIDRLLMILRDADPNLRNRAAWALIRFGDDAVPRLIETVRSSNPIAREEAAWALSNVESPRFVPEFISLLEDENYNEYSLYFIQAISNARSEQAFAYLMTYVRQQQHGYIRGLDDFLASVIKANYTEAGPILVDLLSVVDYRTLRYIIVALVKINYQPAGTALQEIALNTTLYHDDTRRAALEGLYKLVFREFHVKKNETPVSMFARPLSVASNPSWSRLSRSMFLWQSPSSCALGPYRLRSGSTGSRKRLKKDATSCSPIRPMLRLALTWCSFPH